MNLDNQDILYQTETVRYSTGQGAGTTFSEFQLDSSYVRCVGIAINETKNGGIPMYRIGMQDRDVKYFTPVHKNLLISEPSAGLKLENRFLKTNVKADGHRVKIVTEIPVQLTDDLEFDVTFLLVRDKK